MKMAALAFLIAALMAPSAGALGEDKPSPQQLIDAAHKTSDLTSLPYSSFTGIDFSICSTILSFTPLLHNCLATRIAFLIALLSDRP